MFTGLIQTLGQIISHSPDHSELTIQVPNLDQLKPDSEKNPNPPNWFLSDVKSGDSISVNGVCLTALESSNFQNSEFKVNLAPETLSKTNLGELKVKDYVNLEKSLTSETRIGGHFVQGHVDTTATITNMSPDQDSLRITFSLPPPPPPPTSPSTPDYFTYLIPKGYITIDGVSLTLTQTNHIDRSFSIMLIPHTIQTIGLPQKIIGDKVNLEFDMIVKSIVNVVEINLEERIKNEVKKVLEEMKNSNN